MQGLAWRRFWGIGLSLGGIIAACSAAGDNDSSSDGTGASGATGGQGGAPTTGGAGGSGGIDFTSTGGSGACAQTCSADLHSVIDCNGNVITTCPSDQGCAPDLTCIPACEAATAAKSTVGCEYYSQQVSFGCYGAFIANTWDSPISISYAVGGGPPSDASSFSRMVTGNGQSIVYSPLPGGELPVGEVAIVFLSGTCPGGVTTPGAAFGTPFHLTTSRPVVAYDIDPYGGGNSAVTSASLLIPTSAWDLNYIVVAPWPYGPNSNYPRLSITAAEDGTDVTIDPVVAITGGTISGTAVPGTAANTPATYTLNKGQTLQFEQEFELTGSVLLATKPIGVTGSSGCINIDACCCDGAHQQLPPVQALGSAYAAVRYRNRVDGNEESPPWRIVGAVDGTTLTYEPGPPPVGAPLTLAQGEVASFRAAGPFIVRSQDDDHPFYLAGYMTGAGGFNDIGDPEFVNVIPIKQYRSSYVFFTDPTYPETNLIVVRSKASDGMFKDVTLDCLTAPLTGWMPIDGVGDQEYTRVDLVRGNFEQQNGCDNGRREMTSDAPFGLTVWGWGSHATEPAFSSTYVSYAYPAGASVQPINEVVVIPGPD
jgi:hypothetical protein